MSTIIKATDVHKSYKMGKVTLDVIKGVKITVQKGQFVSIIGASGCGKSTLLHILGALDLPDKGHVEFENQRLNSRHFLQKMIISRKQPFQYGTIL